MSPLSSVRCCLLATALLSSAASAVSVTTATAAVAANADNGTAAGGGQQSSLEPRRNGWLCGPTDTTGACLFKGLLKNVVPLFAAAAGTGPWAPADRRKDAEAAAGTGVQQTQSKGIEEYLMEQIQNLLGVLSFGFDLPAEVTSPWTLLKSSFLNARGKKNKNLGPMMAAGFAVMAGTLVPLAFGALFMVAGKALMTSLLAITISGMLGLKALFSKHESSGHQKAYAAAPPAQYYAETQYEHDLNGQYKAQTEAKMHSSAYYTGESGLSGGYYKSSSAEQQADGSTADAMDYYAAATGRPKSDGNNNIVVDNRNHGGGSGAPSVKN